MKVQLSGTMVERIEKNERTCTTELARRLDQALDAGGALIHIWERVQAEADSPRDADKSASPTPDPGSGTPAAGTLRRNTDDGSKPPVIRRRFLAGGMAAAAPAALPCPDIPAAGTTPLPKSIRPQDIDQIRAASTALAQWDNLYGGGGMVREAFIGHLRWANDLLTVPCPAHLHNTLFTAVGQLAITMGASAFDAYDHPTATRLLSFGTRCAEEAANWHLRAVGCNWQARQAIWTGTPDEGLTHAEQGLVRAERLTPREQAMLHNARAHAKMGHHQEALTAIATSDEIFSYARPGEDGPWMTYYDHAQHHGDTGHAAFDLALTNPRTVRTAAQRLHTAVQHHTDSYLRSRALSGTKLATLLMTTGDPHHATATAHRALDEAGRLRSQRALDDLRALGRSTHPYRHHPDITELRHRITTLITP
ncbi:XRE family transcriptional regulator [Streptomyces sp. NPDC091377]|uniref:XRE family transcriptional regulator n=1 Tax=Streptomyces sp. NPDC091377 TaxID=3365995 RepID=UPI0038078625